MPNLAIDSEDLNKALEGIAMSMAMASAVPVLAGPERFAVSGSFGTFESDHALAFGARMRITDHASLGGGLALGLDYGHVMSAGR